MLLLCCYTNRRYIGHKVEAKKPRPVVLAPGTGVSQWSNRLSRAESWVARKVSVSCAAQAIQREGGREHDATGGDDA